LHYALAISLISNAEQRTMLATVPANVSVFLGSSFAGTAHDGMTLGRRG
jgi:hypothetical protein